MTSQQLLLKVQDHPEKPQLYRQSLKEYLSSHCVYAREIWVYDSHLGRRKKMRVPCGSCFHCRETKKNEWVSRCYAHANDFKNVYFVTLTYRSLEPDVKPGSAAWFLRDYLKEALWHLDDHNSTGHMCWSPCVIWQPHFQKFMMRLRKNTGFDDITYICSYEYGKRFGRPHGHFILFTNNTLTKRDIINAWSLSLSTSKDGHICIKTKQKHGHRLAFGNVDFNDLTHNGTFNEAQKVKVDNNFMSADQCFKYVCKYMFKQDYQSSRVELAFNDMYLNGNNQEAWKYRTKYLHEDYQNTLISQLKIDVAASLRCEQRLYSSPKNEVCSPNLYTDNLKFYEKVTFKSPDGVLENGQFRFFYECRKDLFIQQFRPLFRMSRGTPIGSLYVKNHIDQLSQGVFVDPTPEGVSSVVPSYFRRKASEFIYGLRLTSKTSKSPSYIKSCLPLVHQDFSSISSGMALQFLPVYPGKIPFGDSKLLDALCRSEYVLRDGLERFVIHKIANHYEVLSFIYCRSDHNFKPFSYYIFSEWISLYKNKLERSYYLHNQMQMLLHQNYDCFDRIVNLIDEYSPIDFVSLRDSIESDFIHDVSVTQERYDFTHSDPVDK